MDTKTIVEIQQHKLWLESQGYAPKTVRSSISNLKCLARNSDLHDPESVKRALARKDVLEGTKKKYVYVYDQFCRYHGIKWEKPRYTRVEKIPYVPTENDIDQLIGGMSKRLGTIFLFLKETGCRKGEMWDVKWEDIKLKKNLVIINQPEKGSKPRIIRVSPRLISLIMSMRGKTEYVFRITKNSKSNRILSYFWQKRKEIAEKVNNPNLMKVNFKALR